MRTVLATSLALLLGACGHLSTSLPTPATPPADVRPLTPSQVSAATGRIESLVRAQPEAGTVTVCRTPGAKRLLVHFRQQHYVDPALAPVEHRDKRFAEINQTQRELYVLFTRALDSRYAELRVEGREFSNPRELEAKEYYHRLLLMERAGLIAPRDAKRTGEKRRQPITERIGRRYPLKDPAWPSYGFTPGAELLLSLIDGVPILPGQTPAAELAAQKATRHYARDDPRRLDHPAVLDGRETAALDLAARGDSRSLTFILYGAAHAFGGPESCGANYSLFNRKSFVDNVAQWNREHPDNTFSLIEVTPRTYANKEIALLKRAAAQAADPTRAPGTQ